MNIYNQITTFSIFNMSRCQNQKCRKFINDDNRDFYCNFCNTSYCSEQCYNCESHLICPHITNTNISDEPMDHVLYWLEHSSNDYAFYVKIKSSDEDCPVVKYLNNLIKSYPNMINQDQKSSCEARNDTKLSVIMEDGCDWNWDTVLVLHIKDMLHLIENIRDIITAIIYTLDITRIRGICEYFRIDIKHIIDTIMIHYALMRNAYGVKIHINRLIICLNEIYKLTGELPSHIFYTRCREAPLFDWFKEIDNDTLNLEQLRFNTILTNSFKYRIALTKDINIFNKIREICIALYSIKVKDALIPPYVILWILDWFIEEFPHHKKIRLIQRIYDFKLKLN